MELLDPNGHCWREVVDDVWNKKERDVSDVRNGTQQHDPGHWDMDRVKEPVGAATNPWETENGQDDKGRH